MKSAVMIESKKGSLRANHYHKTDWHYCYVVSGTIEYYHRPNGSDQEPECLLVKAGGMVFTPPMVDHGMKFPEDTTFLTLSRNPRDQASYEADVVRVDMLDFGDVTAAAAISNLQTEKTRLFTAVFEKGELVYDDTMPEKLRLRTDPQDPGGTFRLGDGTPLERAVLAFRDAIFKKSPDMKDAVMGRDVVRVLADMDSQLG